MKYDMMLTGLVGYDFTAQSVRSQLAALEDKEVTIYLCSLGGDVADALEIRRALQDHGRCTIHVVGFTASAATIIATGASTLLLDPSALWLMHRSSVELEARVNCKEIAPFIEDLQKLETDLTTIDGVIAACYSEKTGGALQPDEFLKLMDEERWLTAKEVKNLHLCENLSRGSSTTAPEDLAALQRSVIENLSPRHRALPPATAGTDGFLQKIAALLRPSAAVKAPHESAKRIAALEEQLKQAQKEAQAALAAKEQLQSEIDALKQEPACDTTTIAPATDDSAAPCGSLAATMYRKLFTA